MKQIIPDFIEPFEISSAYADDSLGSRLSWVCVLEVGEHLPQAQHLGPGWPEVSHFVKSKECVCLQGEFFPVPCGGCPFPILVAVWAIPGWLMGRPLSWAHYSVLPLLFSRCEGTRTLNPCVITAVSRSWPDAFFHWKETDYISDWSEIYLEHNVKCIVRLCQLLSLSAGYGLEIDFQPYIRQRLTHAKYTVQILNNFLKYCNHQYKPALELFY